MTQVEKKIRPKREKINKLCKSQKQESNVTQTKTFFSPHKYRSQIKTYLKLFIYIYILRRNKYKVLSLSLSLLLDCLVQYRSTILESNSLEELTAPFGNVLDHDDGHVALKVQKVNVLPVAAVQCQRVPILIIHKRTNE